MPRNSSGTYTLPEAAFVPGTVISSTAVNSDFSDIADALTNSLSREGEGGMLAELSLDPDGFTYSNDPNTGMHRTGSDEQAIKCGGTDILTVGMTGAEVTGDVTATGDVNATGDLNGADITGADATLTGTISLGGTSAMKLNVGTTAQRPGTPVAGNFRQNSDTTIPEYYDGVGWSSLSATQPIQSGFKNLAIGNNASTPNTQIDITADAVTAQTTAGRAYRLTSVSVTINGLTSGANGLDSGSLASGTWYAVYVIYNPSTATTAGLLSTSATSPTLPSGYTAFTRLGWARTAGSAQFYGFRQLGRDVQYVLGLAQTTGVRSIVSGSSGSPNVPTWTAASVSGIVPSTASMIRLYLWVHTSGTTGSAMVAPNSNYGAVDAGSNQPPVAISHNLTGNLFYYKQDAVLMLESTNIYYASSISDAGAICLGWTDNI